MTTHHLKVEERWYRRVSDNEKMAEVRLDDRDYQTGDRVLLRVINGNDWQYVEREISHVLRSAPGLADGYVVLSLRDPRVADLRERLTLAHERENRLENRNRGLRGAITRLQREGDAR